MAYDPFDVKWRAQDPLGRDVVMLKSVEHARTIQGKHPDPPESLAAEDARDVVSCPSRIDASASNPNRDVYYKVEKEQANPYSRVVVDFGDDPNVGVAISWSRYGTPVASSGVKWREERT